MEYPSLNYPRRRTSHLDPRSSHHHGQDDLFYADAPGLHDFNTAGTLNPTTRLPPCATNFNPRLKNEPSLRVEGTRGRTPSRRTVSRTSIETSFTSYQHSPSQSPVAGPQHASNPGDQSLERRTYEEILHRHLSDILGLQGPAHAGNRGTSTTPVSGPAPQRPGHGQDFASDTLYSDRENAGYAAHPIQPSAPTFDANTAAPPTLSSVNVADPLHITNAGDQESSWRRQLEAYAYGVFADSVPSQGRAHGRNLPTDTAPFNSHPPQATGYGQDFAPGTLRSNGDNIGYAAHPLQPFTPFLESNSAAAPPVLDPSYTSTLVDVAPKIKSEHYGPPGVSSVSHLSATHRPAPILSNHINSRSLGTSTPSGRPHKVSKSISFERSAQNPNPRRQRQRRLLPNQPNLRGVDLYIPPSHPHIATSESLNPSRAPTQGQPIDNTTKTECSGPSNVSNKNEVDEDEFFNMFLDMEGLIEKPPNDSQVGSLNDPDTLNLIDQNVPEAQESANASTAGRPTGNTGLEPQPQPKRKYRKRTLSTAFPTTTTAAAASEAQRPATKQRKNANPNPVRKNPSCKSRRADPRARYWCADATCHASQTHGFEGFVTREDTRRHLLVHEPPNFVCRLPHKNGEDYWARRKDNLEA